MKNNKKIVRLFYKIISGIVVSTFVISPLSIAFADTASGTQSPDTSSASVTAPATDTTPTVTPTQQPTSSAAVLSSPVTTPDTTTVATVPVLSSDTALTTTLPQHETDVNNALSSITPQGALTPDVMHPALLAATAPTQQTDAPQLSVGSQSKLNTQLNGNTGALQYSYPITVPPGRNNLTPNVGLQYNSQNTANDSIVGYGWNLSIPYISRQAKHGVDQLYTGTYANDYTTSDGGELGQISGNNYQLRSDDGSLSKYVYSATTGWTVTTKTGLTYTYGTVAATRQDDPGASTSIYKWMLDKVTDTNGNSISYSYFKDQGQIYPDTITYTNTSGGNGPFTVVFGREVASTTPPNTYTTGFSVITKYRINTITVAISGTTRHSYALAYTSSDNGARSLLSTVTETGYDPTGIAKTFPPEKFTYTTSNAKTFTQQTGYAMPTHALTGGTRQDSRLGMSGDKDGVWPNAKNGILIDVNGDGTPDWIETEDNGYNNDTSTLFATTNGKFYDVWLGNTGGGWTLNSAWTTALPKDSTGKQYELNNQNSGTGGAVQITDVNGDGLPDFIVTTPGSTLNTDTDTVWLNNGSGWTKSTTWTMPTMSVSGTTYGVALGYNNGTVGPNYIYDTQLIDINNDGLPDIVQTTADSFGTLMTSDHYTVWLNNGSGWTKSTTWTMPVHPKGDGTYYGSIVTGQATDIIMDVNGDGLPDWVETIYSATSNETYDVWLNTGTGWVRSTSWALPVHTNTLPPYTVTTQGVQLGFSPINCNVGIGGSYQCATRSDSIGDINGDGLPDFIETVDNTSFLEYDVVWINNGKNGWIKNTAWTMPMYENTSGHDANEPMRLGDNGTFSTQIADVNNDGLPDFVASCDCGTTSGSANPQFPMIFINTGQGWATSSWGEPTRTGSGAYNGSILGYTQYSSTSEPMQFRSVVLQDVNGDGSLDWIESNQFQTPPTYALGGDPYERYYVWSNSAAQSDLLSSITFDHGATATYTYAPQTIVDKNAATQTQTVEVVTSKTTTDGMGSASSPALTTYSYTNGKFFFPTLTWKKFAGFQKVTITNPDSSKEIDYYHQGNGIDSTTYEYSDAESEIGKLYRTDITDSSGNLFKRSTTEWTSFPITSVASNVAFVYPNQNITETFDGYVTERATAETWAYNTSTGNLTTDTNYGEVTATTPIAYTDIGTDKAVTTNAYATNGTGMYLVDDQTTVDQSSNKVNETQHYYDSAALGTLTLGNETKTSQWKTGATYISTLKSYNTNGTVATTTDGRGKVTTNTTYDTYNLYPITVTDPLTHVTHYTYDYMFGYVVQTTDQNSQVYIKNYDGMGRIASDQIPDPTTPGSTVPRQTYGYTDASTGYSTVGATQYATSGLSIDIEKYYDGYGRLLEPKRQMDPNGNWFNYQTVDYVYDINNRLYKKSLPYIDYGAWNDGGAGGPTLNTTYTYDVMGRVLTATNNLGTTTNVYKNWETTTTDPNGNIKNYYYDAYGNLVKVDEINSGTTYTTNYTYDLNKSLTKITDALGNVRNFTYDGLGRRLTAQDLHASADATYGSWSYTYDDANNLTQSISPNAATVNYTYDNGERELTEDYTGGAGTEITNTYDTCTLGVGKLCTVTMTSGANTTYSYDPDGNVASESKVINANTFLTSYTYNRVGDILTITYPDNSVVQYNYMSPVLVGSVQRKENGGSFTNVLTSISYAAPFQPSTIVFTDNDVTNNTYDSTKLYRLTNKQTQTGSSVNTQNIAYTYDTNGNLTNLVDSSATDASKTVAYTYDNLNRVKTATATGVHSGTTAYSETYNYDGLGNFTSKNGQTYLYQGNTGTLKANPDAATSINGVTYTYDSDGNLTTNGTITNTWNYKDQMTQTVKSGTTVNHYYDQNGNRVWYKVGTANTYYPNKYYSYDGTNKTKQIYLGDTLVATVITDGGGSVTPYFVHADNILGSNVVANYSGSTVQQLLDYFPFGDIRLNEGSGFDEKNKFGGHQYDTQTDLDYFGARYYGGKIGRFISEDPSFLAIGDNNLVQQNAKQSQNSLLMNPQTLNSYAYANNNPTTNIDPDGKIAGVDDAAGFLAGGLIGVGTTLVVNGKNTTWGDVGGSFLTGGIIGWGAVNTPETLGASNAVSASLVTGLVGGFYGNVTKQGINIATGNQKSGINYSEAQKQGVITAGVSGILSGSFDSKIDGLSSGRNSLSAIGKTAQTKFLNGTISSVSPSTAFKSAIGSQANDLYRTTISTGIDFIRSNYNKK